MASRIPLSAPDPSATAMWAARLTLVAIFILTTIRLCAAEPTQIRVLSYNIHHGEGVDGKLDLPRIASVIRAANPTIVALQEVDRGTNRTQRVDQPAELARLTNMQVVFERNIEFNGGEYGNAVLSKLPIIAHRNVHLPSLDGGEQRGALLVELSIGDKGRKLLFICTHLDHRRDSKERLASARKINEIIAPHGTTPIILAGDLNATRESDVLNVLRKQWAHLSNNDLPTIPVVTPKKQIDFIMVRPSKAWRMIETRVLGEAVASDHRAILGVLQLKTD